MQTKLFVGTRFSAELKVSLAAVRDMPFQHIPFEGKEYLGIYVEKRSPTVEDLRASAKAFVEALQAYLPALRADTLQLLVFPQVFLG